MAWNDGVTKQLNDYLDSLTQGGKVDIGQTYIDALKHEVDTAIDDFAQFITPEIPVNTGALKKSFTIEKITNRMNWYGYRAEFEGTAPSGEPYQKIANVLNYGVRGKIVGRYFIDRSVRRLKGLDGKIEKKFMNDLDKKTK